MVDRPGILLLRVAPGLEHEVVVPPGVAMTMEWDDKAQPAGTIELLVLDSEGKNPHGTRLIFRWDKGGYRHLAPMKALERLNPTTLRSPTTVAMARSSGRRGACRPARLQPVRLDAL
jgi:hypothetical protein